MGVWREMPRKEGKGEADRIERAERESRSKLESHRRGRRCERDVGRPVGGGDVVHERPEGGGFVSVWYV